MVNKLVLVFLLLGLQQIALCYGNQIQQCPLDANSENILSETKGTELLVFVSLGMPKNSLLQWSEQANKAGASLVLRGFKGNSLSETLSYARKIWGNKVKNIVIDPTAFERFGINAVPAVLVTEKLNVPEQNDTTKEPKHDVIYGDIGLAYALKKIKEEGDLGSYVEHYLERLTQ